MMDILKKFPLLRNPGLYLLIMIPIFMLVLVFRVDRLALEQHQAQTREEISREVYTLRVQLESWINSHVTLAASLRTLVAMDPDLDQEDFSRAVAPYFQERPYLRNMVLAPDLVVRMVHPIQGNEATLGMDYRNIPAQWETVSRSLETRKIIVAGPLDLVQGGRGFIARVPIYIPHPETGQEYLWGISSMVINTGSLMRLTGLEEMNTRLSLALRGRDARGAQGEVFMGQADLFAQDPVLTDILLPYGSWQMAAMPREGWPSSYPQRTGRLLFFVLISCIFLGLLLAMTLMVEKLRLAREEALAGSRAKSQFLATVSHEIRTPLNAIMGFSHLLRDPLPEEKRQLYLDTVDLSSRNLLSLVDSILDYSLAENGPETLVQDSFSLKMLCQELQNHFLPLVRQKDLDLNLHFAETLPDQVVGDRKKIRQILFNLLDNGIKFTQRGQVLLSLENERTTQEDRAVLFRVQDTGKGIPEEYLEKIMEPFF